MHRTRTSLAALGAIGALTFGAAACSDDDQDAAQDAIDTLVDEAEEAGRTAISAAEDAGRTGVSAVEDAAQDVTNDAAELAVRNIATQQGEEQFANAGHDLDDGGLTCEATVAEDAANVAVTCTGTTAEGGMAELTGETSELPGASVTELEGTFTGTVDGAEVFATESLGG